MGIETLNMNNLFYSDGMNSIKYDAGYALKGEIQLLIISRIEMVFH